MATANLSGDGAPQELSGVVVGWRHRTFARNIHLTVQSSSKASPKPEAVDTHHLLMTRSQAMLLANYLMRLTGQEPVVPHYRSLWQRLFG